MSGPLLEAHRLCLQFSSSGRRVNALDNVSFSIRAGETLGLAGASGSGKSSLARVLLRLQNADRGSVFFEGEDWLAHEGRALRKRRGRMQMVFQDPLDTFNPRATVAGAIGDPLRIHNIVAPEKRANEIALLLDRVGLSAGFAARSIRALSGGQRQRVAIARTLASRPSLIVLDEAVSALDVTVKARILELIVELQRERGIACLFISHDLAAIRAVSHRIAIMDAGRIVEEGAARSVVENPQSVAAQALVAGVPKLVLSAEE